MEDLNTLGTVLAESKAVVLMLLLGLVGMLYRKLAAVETQRDGYVQKFIEIGQANTAALVQFTNALETLSKEVERKP